MQPRPVTDDDVTFWRGGVRKVYDCPPGLVNCSPVVVVEETDPVVVRVPWRPIADDLAVLAAGGTLWLTQWGGLAPHDLTVIPKEDT